PAGTIDPDQLRAHVVQVWGADSVVAHGEVLLPAQLPGFVALEGERIAGHASYRLQAGACELTSIDADPPRQGVGTLLLDAVIGEARRAGCVTVWLTTTNDNLDALGFYQRRGFRLRALRPGAVNLARDTLKPEIPRIGSHGIPMHDELDLELVL
ncbi:MAG TPA: GNAT family N-acetyltransferase, partial [Candidatus Limnocylindria bacterium]